MPTSVHLTYPHESTIINIGKGHEVNIDVAELIAPSMI